MGYILLPPEYIDGNKNDNYHVFLANIINNNGNEFICIEDDSICILDMHLLKNNDILMNHIRKLDFYYLLPTRYSIFNEIDNYYTDRDNSFFYSDNENIIRIISSIIGREVCGDCMSILHSDNY